MCCSLESNLSHFNLLLELDFPPRNLRQIIIRTILRLLRCSYILCIFSILFSIYCLGSNEENL